MSKYKENDRVVKNLRFVTEYGNSNCRYVEFKDEDGVILTWQTTNYNNVYQNLKRNGFYTFTIKYMINDTIFISRLKIEKR